ncbi:MAG TPA: DUF4214 domain-containing protein, partial [Gemmataceae bacterium]
TGTVDFVDSTTGTDLGTGMLTNVNGQAQATLTTTTINSSSDSITATFQGGNGLASSTGSTGSTATGTATTTTVSGSGTAGNGQSVTLTATVTAANSTMPTGTVQFVDSTTGTTLGSATLTNVNGQAQATLTTTAINSSSDIITATYLGGNGFASSTGSTGSTATGAASSNQLWLQQVYQNLLGRAVDPSGLTYWNNVLNSGASRTQVAFMITQTVEYHTDQVMTAYQKLLGTAPDPSTLSYFVGLLGSGTSIEGVDAIIIGSNTFFTSQGGDSTASWLNAVYQNFLNRPLDSSGSAIWQQALASGQSLTQVAQEILSTSEYYTDLVQNMYQTYLGRAADPTSLSAFVASLQSGGGSDATVISAILGSPEFLARATGTATTA